jgi:bla regulator protein BlaR1
MDASHVSHDLFLRILVVSGQASLLALLIVALQRLLRGWLSPGWRHALWSLLLVRLLLLWSVPTSLSVFTVVRNVWRTLRNAAIPPVAQALSTGESTAPVLTGGAAAFPAMQWMIALWSCGAAITLALAVTQACRLGRQARRRTRATDPEVLAVLDACRREMGMDGRVPILCGPAGSAPALLGFLRPRLLVPAGLLAPEARAHLRYVLLHELAHIRRRDVLTGWLAYILLSLHWFNPLLWWAKRRCSDDREMACDARVLSLLTPKERRAYGHALLDQFRLSSAPLGSPGLVGVLGGSSGIKRRIEMITSFEPSRRKGTVPALLAVMLLTVTALTGEEEAATANPPLAAVAALPAASGPPLLLAMEQPRTAEAVIPSAVTETPAVAPQATPPADAEDADRAAAAETKPIKKDRARAAAVKHTDKPAAMAKAATPQSGNPTKAVPQESMAAEEPVPVASPAKAASDAPVTLHSAINKAAADYAQSLEAKSTRPERTRPLSSP